jgi:hypothetical protein
VCTSARECVSPERQEYLKTVHRHDGLYIRLALGVGFLTGTRHFTATFEQASLAEEPAVVQGTLRGLAQGIPTRRAACTGNSGRAWPSRRAGTVRAAPPISIPRATSAGVACSVSAILGVVGRVSYANTSDANDSAGKFTGFAPALAAAVTYQ